MVWTNLGMNYGHQISGTSYDTAQIDADLTFLYNLGFRKLRVAYPTFSSATTITNCQDLVSRALAKGFSVLWGCVSGTGVTATTWGTFKTYVSGTLAPWAQGLNNANFELALGNEEELHADGSTLTAATVRSDIKSLATTVQGVYTVGSVSYQADSSQIASWNALGLGDLDFIGFNVYNTVASFTTNIKAVRANFGALGFISEFSAITNGYADFTDEQSWYVDVVSRMQALMINSLARAYFFTYRDGGFGTTANAFAMKLSTGETRLAFEAVRGARIAFIN